jgi:hypothetical protein
MIVDAEGSRRLGHGQTIQGELQDAAGNRVEGCGAGDEAAAMTQEGQLQAIVRRKGSAWHPFRVFPLIHS